MDEALQNQLKALQKANNWLAIVQLLEPECQPGRWGWNDGAALSTLGFAYSQLGRLDQARAIYQRWIEVEPDRAQPFYCLGYIYYLEANWHQAMRWFQEALRIFPEYLVCLYRLAYAHQALHSAAHALPLLEKVQQIYQASNDEDWKRRQRKTFVKARFLQAKVHNSLRQYQKAAQLLQGLLEQKVDRYVRRMDLYYELGKALAGLRQWEPALQAFQQAAALADEPQPYIHDQIGRVLHGQGRYREAIQAYNRALKIRRFAYILLNRARSNRALGQFTLAVRDLQEALKRDRKGKHKIYLELGYLYLEQKKLIEAGHYFRQAIQFKKKTYGHDFAEAHYALVFYYLEKGEPEAARQALLHALELRPDLEWDRNLVGLLKLNPEALQRWLNV